MPLPWLAACIGVPVPQLVPVELVVNVDSAEAAADWAGFVANTSGTMDTTALRSLCTPRMRA